MPPHPKTHRRRTPRRDLHPPRTAPGAQLGAPRPACLVNRRVAAGTGPGPRQAPPRMQMPCTPAAPPRWWRTTRTQRAASEGPLGHRPPLDPPCTSLSKPRSYLFGPAGRLCLVGPQYPNNKALFFALPWITVGAPGLQLGCRGLGRGRSGVDCWEGPEQDAESKLGEPSSAQHWTGCHKQHWVPAGSSPGGAAGKTLRFLGVKESACSCLPESSSLPCRLSLWGETDFEEALDLIRPISVVAWAST